MRVAGKRNWQSRQLQRPLLQRPALLSCGPLLSCGNVTDLLGARRRWRCSKLDPIMEWPAGSGKGKRRDSLHLKTTLLQLRPSAIYIDLDQAHSAKAM